MTFSKKNKSYSYLLFSVAGSIVWTIVISGFCFWTIKNIYSHSQELSKQQARAFFQEIVTTRSWNASHGGVYVPITDKTKPNPYLDIPNRDVTTTEGLKLTKINPAYMTRQIAEIALDKNLIWFHITSLKPIRPKNKADKWESDVLKRFSKNFDEFSEFIESENGKFQFRYMAPLWVEKSCLKCHAKQGYKEGDIRGGISVNIRAEEAIISRNEQVKATIILNSILWFIGLCGILISLMFLAKEKEKKEKVIEELQEALKDIKKLSGLVPICSSCKKVRDDKGYWNHVESYIEEHSEAHFSHGICEECSEKLYGQHDWYKDRKKNKKL